MTARPTLNKVTQMKWNQSTDNSGIAKSLVARKQLHLDKEIFGQVILAKYMQW